MSLEELTKKLNSLNRAQLQLFATSIVDHLEYVYQLEFDNLEYAEQLVDESFTEARHYKTED